MRFLLDANMPRSALSALTGNGHDAVHVCDVGLKDAPDERIAEYALSERRTLISRDLDFADVRRYPPVTSQGYLVLRVPDSWVATAITDLLARFLEMEELVAQMPGHLVILDPGQARFRPALAMKSGSDG